jgi:hypothetical protein
MLKRRYSFDNVKRNGEYVEYDRYTKEPNPQKPGLHNFIKECDFQPYRKPDWVLNFNWNSKEVGPQLKNQQVWISDKKICHYNNFFEEDRTFTVFIMGDNYLDYCHDVYEYPDNTFNENTFLGKLHKFWQNKLNKLIGKEYNNNDDDCPYYINIDTKEYSSRFDIDTKVKEEDCNCAIMCPCDACDGEKFKFHKFK